MTQMFLTIQYSYPFKCKYETVVSRTMQISFPYQLLTKTQRYNKVSNDIMQHYYTTYSRRKKEYSNLVTLSKKIIDTYFRVINSKRFSSIDICI